MKITAHGTNLVQITRWPRVFPINVQIVREDDGLTLIDTGMAGMAPMIRDHASAMGMPIKRIVLTHAHTDHVGGLEALNAFYPEAEILAAERTAQFIAGNTELTSEEAAKGKLRGGYQTVDVQCTRFLQPGDTVGSLEVIAAPGHAPDQIALLDRRDGTLVAADALVTRGGLAVSGMFRLLFPFPALATWHKPTALDTAKVLRGHNPARLAVGHGPVIEDPIAEMDAAIAEAEAKVGERRQHAC